jgi:hypothetical protein
MKLMKSLFCFVSVVLVLSACNFSSGKIITEKRELEAFSELKISGMANVAYKYAEDYFLEIETGESAMENVSTEVIDGVLEINTFRWLSNIDDANVTVYSPVMIRKINLFDDANLSINEEINSDKIEMFIVGTGKIKIDNLKLDDLEIVSVGGGFVEILGEVTNCNIESSTSTAFNLENLFCNNMEFKNASAADSKINVKENLKISILSSSNVEYIGNPETDFQFVGIGEIGDVISVDNGSVYSQCSEYESDLCPNYCQVCPPCPECSSLSCFHPSVCAGLGFDAEWSAGVSQ